MERAGPVSHMMCISLWNLNPTNHGGQPTESVGGLLMSLPPVSPSLEGAISLRGKQYRS